jgi:hypothetical protein
MTSQSFIVQKMDALLDETVHIMPESIAHFHGHWNKMVPLMKPSTLVDFNNGIKFHMYTS